MALTAPELFSYPAQGVISLFPPTCLWSKCSQFHAQFKYESDSSPLWAPEMTGVPNYLSKLGGWGWLNLEGLFAGEGDWKVGPGARRG